MQNEKCKMINNQTPRYKISRRDPFGINNGKIISNSYPDGTSPEGR
jgi:hypothetical protein